MTGFGPAEAFSARSRTLSAKLKERLPAWRGIATE